jgi:hypothetical protein
VAYHERRPLSQGRERLPGLHGSGRVPRPLSVERNVLTELIAAADAAWDERLAHVPRDVYHSAGYHRFAAASVGGEPFLVVVGDAARGVAWPYLLRPVAAVDGLEESGAFDVDSVYGYPGPLAWGVKAGDPFLADAWREIRGVWRDQRAVAAFTRFHPLLENVEAARSFRGEGDEAADPIVAGGRTVSIDCRQSDEDALAGYGRVLRQEIAGGRRAGLVTTPDDEWSEVDTFIRLYADTMARNKAPSSYDVGREDILRLRDELGGHLHLLVTRIDGDVAGAQLFFEFEGIVQAHLVGTDDRHRKLSPLKVMLDDARIWARARGNGVLHLGGGRGGRADSLLAFKGRFSARRHDFYTGRWILDPTAYARLVGRRSAATRRQGLAVADASWFPAYRAPLAAPEGVSTAD